MDPNTPIETTMAALKELVEEGKVKYVGLSECTPAELRRAHAVHPVTAVQMEWSLQTRDVEAPGGMVDTCRELGVGIVAYSPLGRGMLSATFARHEDIPAGDWRLSQPRWQKEAFERNAAKAAGLAAIAARKGCTPGQLALAWLLAKDPHCVPIPGTKSPTRLIENMGAVAVTLTPEEVKEIEASVPEPEGERYDANTMKGVWTARL